VALEKKAIEVYCIVVVDVLHREDMLVQDMLMVDVVLHKV
jgi:hypothetical protein